MTAIAAESPSTERAPLAFIVAGALAVALTVSAAFTWSLADAWRADPPALAQVELPPS